MTDIRTCWDVDNQTAFIEKMHDTKCLQCFDGKSVHEEKDKNYNYNQSLKTVCTSIPSDLSFLLHRYIVYL